MSEPVFAVPLSKLASIYPVDAPVVRWEWICLFYGEYDFCQLQTFASESAARAAAVAHLEQVHGIRVAEDSAADVSTIAEVLLDVFPEVYGYRIGDEPANLEGALGRDAEKIAARLLPAGKVVALNRADAKWLCDWLHGEDVEHDYDRAHQLLEVDR